jgi:hypothetical protein
MKEAVDVSNEESVRRPIRMTLPLRFVLPLEMKLAGVSGEDGVAG